FGLPAEAADAMLGREASWAETIAWVADRPPDEVRDAAPGFHKTPRRTDAGGAMAPLDPRLYKQTVEGLRCLHEIRAAAEVAVLPQAPRPGAAITLIEVYPSATATDLGIRCRRAPSRPGEVRARPRALHTWLDFADPSLEAIAVSLEDAWDATLACLTAWLARDDLEQPRRVGRTPEPLLQREGWIFRPPAAVG
ncbi:MAG: hypothetical protein M3409_06145, partial [Gemmatimonadota bacterium]|nr:hypothetical protein [Gemmatimonadota bacterium]